jgi:hypothetical protein
MKQLFEQCPSWVTDGPSAGQEIPHLSRNWGVHYQVLKSLPLHSILNHLFEPHFYTLSLRSILLWSTPRSSKWSFSFRFSCFDCRSYILWIVQIMISSLCKCLHTCIPSFVFDTNILLITLQSNTLICSYPSGWETKNHIHAKQLDERIASFINVRLYNAIQEVGKNTVT